jgi:transcriptional regulator with XRE-family HTH domain
MLLLWLLDLPLPPTYPQDTGEESGGVLRKTVGYRIRELRKAQKLSQQKLAERCDISWQYLGNIERGEAAATIDALEKLIKALGSTPGQVLAADEIENAREIHELIADVPPKARVHILGAMRHVILAVREAARESSGRRR